VRGGERRVPLLKSLMTPFPWSVDADATLSEARAMMEEHGIHHLPVERGRRIVGVLDAHDVRRALEAEGRCDGAAEPRVRDVMAADPYVVDLNERLDNVLLHLADAQIGCAVVVRAGKLAGIFTQTDACRAFGEHLREVEGTGGDDDVA
jgi:acetoin utilization protein AcuB